MDRRSFLNKVSAGSIATMIGVDIVFGSNMSSDYIPVIFEQDLYSVFGKHKDMIVLNDRPWNVEAQPHILDDRVTPANKMFIRNNGIIPSIKDSSDWELKIAGKSAKTSRSYSLEVLKSRFTKYTYQLTLECAGNGRSEFDPPAKGNQWTLGAVSCARWSGLRLRDLMEDAGYNADLVYIGYTGADTHLSGDPARDSISRGIPLEKAIQDETLLAYEMNGNDIPIAHGFPLRLVAGGWPASASGKWLDTLLLRNKVHDGEKMTGQSYRIPCETVEPGAKVADEDMCIIESMPVKSLITFPKSGAVIKRNETLPVRGHAWAGELAVREVQYSIDFGATWQKAKLESPVNRLAWQHFNAKIKFPRNGYYEVWARATDSNGKAQPMVLPGWNPKGYLNNACHRIAVKVE